MDILEVKADITGVVVEVVVTIGGHVKEGDTLLILESMKMEIPQLAPEDSTVKKVLVKDGDVVNEDDVIVILEK